MAAIPYLLLRRPVATEPMSQAYVLLTRAYTLEFLSAEFQFLCQLALFSSVYFR